MALPPPSFPPPPSSANEKGLMAAAHLSAPVAYLLSAGWLSFVGPLVVWLMAKGRAPQAQEAAAGAFNFNVSMTLISWGIWASVLLTLGVGIIWALPLLGLLFLLQCWAHLRGLLASQEGRVYRYPLQVPLLK